MKQTATPLGRSIGTRHKKPFTMWRAPQLRSLQIALRPVNCGMAFLRRKSPMEKLEAELGSLRARAETAEQPPRHRRRGVC